MKKPFSSLSISVFFKLKHRSVSSFSCHHPAGPFSTLSNHRSMNNSESKPKSSVNKILKSRPMDGRARGEQRPLPGCPWEDEEGSPMWLLCPFPHSALHNNTNILSWKAKSLLFLSHVIVLIPCGRTEMNGSQPDLISSKYSEPEKGVLSRRMPTYIPV